MPNYQIESKQEFSCNNTSQMMNVSVPNFTVFT